MLMPDGSFKCDSCKQKTMNKETVNYSYLPFEKNPDRKLFEYCDECVKKLQKDFSANLTNI